LSSGLSCGVGIWDIIWFVIWCCLLGYNTGIGSHSGYHLDYHPVLLRGFSSRLLSGLSSGVVKLIAIWYDSLPILFSVENFIVWPMHIY
jgi:hypothetical protein